MMELQELMQVWQNADDQLDNKVQINKALFKTTSLNKIKSNLWEIKFENILEIVLTIPFFFFLIGFIGNHFFELKFLIPALILMAMTLFSFWFNGQMLYLYFNIQPNASIVTTQRNLQKIRHYQIMDINLLLALIPLFSATFPIVIAKAFIGLDLYLLFPLLVMYVGGSLLVGIVLVLILRLFPNRKLKKSIEFLREIEDLER